MSSGKRRDKKNRVLHSGEIQLSNGRYRYKYVNFDGKENYVYSWRLVDTDPTPSGKKKVYHYESSKKKYSMIWIVVVQP